MVCCKTSQPTPAEELRMLAIRNVEDANVIRRCIESGGDVHFVPPRPPKSKKETKKTNDKKVTMEGEEEEDSNEQAGEAARLERRQQVVQDQEAKMSTLMLFAMRGNAVAFRVCMETKSPINFSGNDSNDWEDSLLFTILKTRGGSKEAVGEMIEGVVERLEKKVPGDHADWAQRNLLGKTCFANAFLSKAADQHLLHIVWPRLRSLMYFTLRKDPFPIDPPICDEDDWALLTESERTWFTPLNGIADPSTTRLWRAIVQSAEPDIVEIRQAVEAGAKVQKPMIGSVSSLEQLVLYGDVKGVQMCMRTTLPIHFSNEPETGRNILILACQYCRTKVALSIIKSMVKRIKEERPEDTIDWDQKDASGNDFFSNAAYYDLLHILWPTLRRVPAIARRREPIPIYGKVTEEDWKQLGDDQRFFRPMEGAVPRRFRLRGDRYLYRDGILTAESWEEVQWEKTRDLGVGSFGGVYLGRLSNGVDIAVKIQNPNSSFRSLQELNLVLVSELEVMKCVRHKYVAEFYASQIVQHGAGARQLQLLLEYCPGYGKGSATVKEVLKTKPAVFSPPVVRAYVKQMLEGLMFLHANNVLHRDLKPSNVMLTKNGEHIKLTDFGCFKIIKEQSTKQALMSSKMYSPPEVLDAMKGNRYSRAGDVWSLGCTLLKMYTRLRPWIEDFSELQLITKVCYSKEMPSGFVKNAQRMDPKVRSFLEGCFAFEPAARQTAEQLLHSAYITCPDEELKEFQ